MENRWVPITKLKDCIIEFSDSTLTEQIIYQKIHTKMCESPNLQINPMSINRTMLKNLINE